MIKFKYVGKGWYPGIPAKDIDDELYDNLSKDNKAVLDADNSGLYEKQIKVKAKKEFDDGN